MCNIGLYEEYQHEYIAARKYQYVLEQKEHNDELALEADFKRKKMVMNAKKI